MPLVSSLHEAIQFFVPLSKNVGESHLVQVLSLVHSRHLVILFPIVLLQSLHRFVDPSAQTLGSLAD